MNNNFLSVIMPALNEEANITEAINETLKAFDLFCISGEVLIINDGSTDTTEEKVTELLNVDNRVRLINHQTPQGIGASFWDGIDNAKGNYVTMFPGDNENDPVETLRYYPILEHVDIVIPFVYNKHVRSRFRNFLSATYISIINKTFRINLNYTNGTVMYRKEILHKLKYRSASFFFQTDILIRLLKQKYLFAEVPYRLNMRKTGKSKAVSYPSLIQVTKGYFNLIKDIYYKDKKKQYWLINNKQLRGSATAKRRILDQQLKNKNKLKS